MDSFYDFSLDGLDGTPDLLGRWRGHVTLAVNVASKCGYTPQYADLQGLYRELQEQRFTVIGIPCNQFGAQEPGTPAEIQSFCSLTYGVSFPLAQKVDVVGPGRHPLFGWLTSPANGFPGDVGWNFEKFLIKRDGKLAARYPSGTTPRDAGLLQDVVDLV